MYNISDIKNPEFLKELKINELKTLAKDIREFLIKQVAKNGGYLGSNLSVVELTIALHAIFDTPTDRILFDGGYQCYCHKILTGRSVEFSNLRKYDGLSGYFNQDESPYDTSTGGHFGNAVAKALGIALARDLHCETFEVVCVIGEDSLMTGRTLASLKELSKNKHKVIIILNDNGETSDKAINPFTKAINGIRTSSSYLDMKNDLKANLDKNKFGQSVAKAAGNIKNGIKEQIIDGGIFDTFGIDYSGPIDGHNFKELFKALNKAKASKTSSVIHILTSKTKGYEVLERQNLHTSNAQGFIYHSAKQISSTPSGCVSFDEAVIENIKRFMHANPNSVCISTSNHFNNGYNQIFNTFPKRCLDFNCNEENAIGTAIGLSKEGVLPLVNIDANYITHIVDDLFDATINERQKIVLFVSDAGLKPYEGGGKQGIFDLTFLNQFENLKIFAPSSLDDLTRIFINLNRIEGTVVIRYSSSYLKKNCVSLNEDNIYAWHKCYVHNDYQASIITYGNDIDIIVNEMKINDLPYQVINAKCLNPLDKDLLNQLIIEGKPVLIYQQDYKLSGLGERILCYFKDKNAKNAIKIMSVEDPKVAMGTLSQLKSYYHLDINSLFAELKSMTL